MIGASVSSYLSSLTEAWIITFAAAGGIIVFVGLLLEKFSEKKEWYKNINHFRRCEFRKSLGEWLVIGGIFVEIAVAVAFAVNDWEMEIKNNPLKQPVSQVSAILRFEVSATNYDPRKPISLDSTWMNFGSFNLSAKEARWFEHVDNFATHHVKFYGIALRFGQNILPSSEWNDINNTNNYDFMPPSITVTDAIAQITRMQAYVDFIPKNTEVVKCSARIFINGYKEDFQINTNCISKDLSEWNPDKPGIFLDVTNLAPNSLSR